MATSFPYSNRLKTFCLLSVFICQCLATPSPMYQWPLLNISGLAEVVEGHNHLKADDNKQCFKFDQAFDQLGHDVLKLGVDSANYLTTDLSNKMQFEDITISFLVFAVRDPVGTILHYTIDEDEFFRVTFHPMAPITFVSFRDEYDNPAGIITVENLLTLDYWNHVVIQRRYSDGLVRVYSNGVQKANKDEMDEIGLPVGGSLTIGNTLNDLTQQFTGFVSCLQIFPTYLNEDDMEDVWRLCQRKNWSVKPKVYLEDEGSTDLKCLTDTPPSPPPTQYIPSDDNFLTITALVNENIWRGVRAYYKWYDAKTTSGYFRRVSTDGAPTDDVTRLGIVNTTDLRTCSRLCMRIRGCQTFAFESRIADAKRKQCLLYDALYEELREGVGVKYFSIHQ